MYLYISTIRKKYVNVCCTALAALPLLGLQGVLEQVVFVIQDERSAITGQVAFECDFFHSLEEVFVNDLYILYVSAYILQLC
jgi:hypothetical protein